MVVVDASCAVKWFVPEAGSDLAERLLDPAWSLIAPDLLAVETMNALLRKQRRGEVTEAVPAQALGHLQSLGIAVMAHEPLLREAIGLSLRHRHGIYDCLYLTVARRRGAALATFDRRLAALAQSLAIPLWSPDDVQEHP
ncbi:type II toxin-antitoxin system VapC family toxin [Paracraurococcus lichenis]|uniref:Ribonuclease VapC n=1 Tax=Paracraurococcus lichenis TaxID=3064888 RepID=A0ABT9DZ21_9PROT|nr:type II toxin-antitoxin system VapC family toxin [Paracraurococcus sp. LOR1-02]MDO9709153.1 type II toxin-antitoxin system VapC family toxin [Paracraurococcus sp. LOR1-02]